MNSLVLAHPGKCVPPLPSRDAQDVTIDILMTSKKKNKQDEMEPTANNVLAVMIAWSMKLEMRK